MQRYALQLARGRVVRIDDPKPGDIDGADIAHALARICRFGGHVAAPPYSVAQHSMLVSQMCEPELRLHGLLHDAAEAYLGDIVAPLKALLDDYQVYEYRWLMTIGQAFGLGDGLCVLPQAVKEADRRALALEARDLMAAGEGRDLILGSQPPPRPADALGIIEPLPWDIAERAFSSTLASLMAAQKTMAAAEAAAAGRVIVEKGESP